MIKYLRHPQIDKTLWDDCISSSANRRVYAFSWYLDLVSPSWDALVLDDYKAVFPLTHKRRWFLRYLAQPFFAQQLGVFSRDPLSGSLVADFMRAIPSRFRFVEIQMNSLNDCPDTIAEITTRKNHELALAAGYEQISANYSKNTVRNIRKSRESGLSLTQNTGPAALIGLFRENFGNREGKLQEGHYDNLQRLISMCLDGQKGFILGVNNSTGGLSAGAFFLFDHHRVYYLFAASAPEARENGAMFLLIDHFIATNAGANLVLDFEGGNDFNLGRFYKGFGAMEVPYPATRLSRFPSWVEKLVYFIRNN
ncbi:MAG: GNAT family N-acetyltransferase [Bacteroidales bacterium]